MEKSSYRFDMPTHHKTIIKVIGVGGGGSNAVNNMYKRGIKGVAFVVCNTDAQALEASPVQTKFQLGINLTAGLGAGANPEVGKNAAIESKEDIKAFLSDGTKMIFITAGMGGGTGTGAAPVIAGIAKKLGILTVGIVTSPFAFEGKKKMQQAQDGIKELRENCDTVLVILNDRLRDLLGNLSISTAFAQADAVLTTAAKSIAEIITVPGYVNVDFEDVKTVMRNAGAAVMGSGQVEGEKRAIRAAEAALASPLLDYKDIHGAQKILLSIVSGEEAELQMEELTAITDYIRDKVGNDAEMIFGHGSDPLLKESLRVTVIATGFERKSHIGDSATSSLEEKEPAHQSNTLASINVMESEESTMSAHDNNAALRSKKVRKKLTSQDAFVLPLDLSYKSQTNQHWGQSDDEHNDHHLAAYKIKELLEVPAYIRKGIKLSPMPSPQEYEICRFHLEEDEYSDSKKGL